MLLGVKCGGCVGLTTLPQSVIRLSRQCGALNISQLYRPPRPVTGIAFFTVNVMMGWTAGFDFREEQDYPDRLWDSPSFLSSGGGANARNCGALPPRPHTSSWYDVYLIKHRENFTRTFTSTSWNIYISCYRILQFSIGVQQHWCVSLLMEKEVVDIFAFLVWNKCLTCERLAARGKQSAKPEKEEILVVANACKPGVFTALCNSACYSAASETWQRKLKCCILLTVNAR
jgi:hypothetical protein